jgi:hypothetical protein
MKWRLLSLAVFFILIVSMLGCTATILLEDQFDIRIMNKTGETVRVRWDDGSYHYVENESIITISSVNGGYHELKWEWNSPNGRKGYKEVYEFSIDANFEIVIQDDPDDSIIIIEY